MAPTKRSVLVTGCSDGGLGAAIALEMHRSGHWRVLASARNLKKMGTLASAGIETLALDVLSEDSLRAAVGHVSELVGGALDGLLLNAGGGLSMPVADIQLSAMRALYELNVFSPIRTIQLFLPLLLASTNSPIIINQTSAAALPPVGGLPWQSAYNSSKAALSSVTETLRFELSAFGIRVVELRTGSVKSNFFANLSAKATASETVPRLPAGSVYEAARPELEAFMSGSMMETDSMDQEAYAQCVVRDLNGGWFRSGLDVIYRGKYSSVAGWMNGLSALIPQWLINHIVRDVGQVYAVDKKIRAARAHGKTS